MKLVRAVRATIKTTCVMITLFSFFILTSCEREQAGERVSGTRLLFDTFCTITIYTGSDIDASQSEALIDEAFTICEQLETRLSITIEGSDVWLLNSAGGEEISVSGDMINLVKRALEFAALSDGLFDITIGRLSRLWDFGDTRIVPKGSEIEKALQSVDFRQVIVNENTIQVQNNDTWIDLGGIAKGYIADMVGAFLSENGIDSALIDFGGDILTLGSRPDGSPWRLGVRKPFGSIEEYIGVLEAHDVAVISSGVYERMFEEDGVMYHHILDPKTGYPVNSDVVAATVIANDAVTGEGLATIAVLAGSERILEIFEQTQGFIGAVLVLDDGEVLTYGQAELHN